MGQEKDLAYYHKLIKCNKYCKLMKFLESENGEVQENYHKPKKYECKKDFHRHHKYELFYDNLGDKKKKKHIKDYEKYQRKENLVYCNLIEHFIIHSLIIIKRSQKCDSYKYELDDNDQRNGFKSFKLIFKKNNKNKPSGLNSLMGQINHNYIKGDHQDTQGVSAEDAENIINCVGEKLIQNAKAIKNK